MAKHHQRLIIGALHHGFALRRVNINRAEPAPPLWWFLLTAFKTAGDGMAFARFSEARIKAFFRNSSGWQGGQNTEQGCAGDRHAACIFRASCNQQSAAILHILRDIIIIEQRQHIAVLIAIKNDQVEIFHLIDEQFARREDDQR